MFSYWAVVIVVGEEFEHRVVGMAVNSVETCLKLDSVMRISLLLMR